MGMRIIALGMLAVLAAVPVAAPLLSAAPLQAEAQKSVGTVTFAADSDAIGARAKAELDRIAKLHAVDKKQQVVIRGHSDSAEGDESYGWGLSQRRANEVRSSLVVLGVPPGQITVEAWSLKKPAVPGSSPRNRRAEILFGAGAGW